MQKHVHSSEVKGCRILFLTIDAVGLATSGGAEQQGTRTAGGVIDVFQAGLSRGDDFSKYLADLLWRVELACFLACSGCKL